MCSGKFFQGICASCTVAWDTQVLQAVTSRHLSIDNKYVASLPRSFSLYIYVSAKPDLLPGINKLPKKTGKKNTSEL
jgi:hypothetical protein